MFLYQEIWIEGVKVNIEEYGYLNWNGYPKKDSTRLESASAAKPLALNVDELSACSDEEPTIVKGKFRPKEKYKGKKENFWFTVGVTLNGNLNLE